jgi:hypothetical protein
MEYINQNSTYVLTLSFIDENGNAVTPSSSKYRIDVSDGNAVTGNNANHWVAFTPSNSTYDLAISANENAMSNNSNNREERIVTILFKYSADSKELPLEYRYMLTRLENLSKT